MTDNTQALHATKGVWQKAMAKCADDPMTAVVAASGATIGSFVLVLSGIGAMQLALH